MRQNKKAHQLNQEREELVKALGVDPFSAPLRPEPKPLGSICNDPDDLTSFLSTALVIIFVLVVALLILAIVTMGELLDVIRTVKLEGSL